MLKHRKIRNTFLLILFIAFVPRIAMGLPGMVKPELLTRPDSASYLAPSASIFADFTYQSGGVPTALRVPLYPAVLAFGRLLGGGSMEACIIFDSLIGALAPALVFLAALLFTGKIRRAFVAGFLLAFSPTAIAFAPMFLSDSLFMTLVAAQLLFFLRYWKFRKTSDLLFCAVFSGLGTLTRPLNLIWFFPCAFTIFLFRGTSFRRKILHTGMLAFISFGIVLPWIVRNHAIGAGWRIDAVSADSLKHNASVVESRATGIDAEKFRQEYAAYFERIFKENPGRFHSENARLSFQEKYLADKIRKYPGLYFSGFLNPVLFVPDVPTLLENLNLSKGGKGTWDVIVKHGLFAGINHYFEGNRLLPLLVIPLASVLLVTYLAAGWTLILAIREKRWELLFFTLLFCAYYVTVTGPVAYPRFQLPALPFLSVLACAAVKRGPLRITEAPSKTAVPF